MDNKFFGIDPSERATIPDAKRATGFQATQEPYQYINQALFELKTDHIIGTAAQLAADSCTCKYQSSDQTLRDADGTEVTLSDGDRVYIVGLDSLDDDFDLSAYDRLRVTSDGSVTLNSISYDFVFGDSTRIDIQVTDGSRVTYGAGSRGAINGNAVLNGDIILPDGKGIDFSAYTDGSVAGTTSSQLLDDYEEGTWTPAFEASGVTFATAIQEGFYTKIGNLVTAIFYIRITSATSTSNAVSLTGLPYTRKAGTYNQPPVTFGYVSNLSLTYNILRGYIGSSSATINFQQQNNYDHTDIVPSSGFYAVTMTGSVTYQV